MSETETRSAEEGTKNIFEARLRKFAKENPEDYQHLKGYLKEWGYSVALSGASRDEKIGDMIADKIDYVVEKRNQEGNMVTVEQFVDELFEENPHSLNVAADLMVKLINVEL